MASIKVEFSIDQETFTQFSSIVRFLQKDINDLMETYMKDYVEQARRAINNPRPRVYQAANPAPEEDYMVFRRLDKWIRDQSHPYHILQAFFMCVDADGYASYDEMRQICSDFDEAQYVKNFAGCFSNMTREGGQHYGKAFNRDGDEVTLWEEVSDFIMSRKDSIY